jgi:hypothetical protein
MFGMTKKQFLKRSSKCLDETGRYALLTRGLIIQEKNGTIDNESAYRQVKSMIEGIESTFFSYEKINPPSQCNSLYQRILHSMIMLQDSISTNYDYINMLREDKLTTAKEKFEESQDKLDQFRENFRPLTGEIDKLLND